jgi:DinB superfamily
MDPLVAKLEGLFKEVHAQLRDEVRGVPVEELNWKPAPDTNSVAALVVHTLGSEAEVWRVAANVTGERDRDAEFRATADDASTLLRELDQADSYLEALAPRVTAEDLAAERPRGERLPQTSLHWLVTNYGHAREHLAQIQLTKQLYEQAQS